MTTIALFPVTKFGICIPDNPSYEEFEQAVETATDANNGSCWALGDLFELSRQRDDYLQAFDDCKKSLKTLQNYATVVRSFPKRRRTYDLSFSHYREVCCIKDEQGNPLEFVQDELLRQAVKDNLNRDELRDRVKQARGKEETRQTVEAQVGIIDSLLQKDYGLAPGTIVKVSFTVEVVTNSEQDTTDDSHAKENAA